MATTAPQPMSAQTSAITADLPGDVRRVGPALAALGALSLADLTGSGVLFTAGCAAEANPLMGAAIPALGLPGALALKAGVTLVGLGLVLALGRDAPRAATRMTWAACGVYALTWLLGATAPLAGL